MPFLVPSPSTFDPYYRKETRSRMLPFATDVVVEARNKSSWSPTQTKSLCHRSSGLLDADDQVQQRTRACELAVRSSMMLPTALAAPAEDRRLQDPHRPPRRSLPVRAISSGGVAFIVWTEVISVHNSDQRLVVHEAWRSSCQNLCACDESHPSRIWVLITRVVSMSFTSVITETGRVCE